jgi:hypothetical protein
MAKNNFFNKKNTNLAKLGNTVDGPVIKKSTIKDIGFGLFADKNYKRNEKITVYGGKIEYNKIDGEYVFMLCADPPVYINGDTDFHPSEKGRWINHGNKINATNTNASNQFTVKTSAKTDIKSKITNTANTKFVLSLAKTKLNTVGEFPICYVIASRDIKKGEELFVDYGPLYW